MNAVTIPDELQSSALHVLQGYMAGADLEEVGYIAALARAFKAAETLPEMPEVVKIDGPVEVVLNADDFTTLGGTD